MEAVGWVTTVVVAGGVIVVLVVGITSIPDIRRYLKIRSM